MPLDDWTPAAIIFDCDGTLLDTERHWERAREEVLRDHGVTLGADFADLTRGRHYTECGRLMAEAAGLPARAEEFTEQLLEAFRRLVVAEPRPAAGAGELLEKIGGGLPLAVASNCPREIVEAGLEHAGFLHWFAHIVVPDGDIRPKPYPDVYLTASHLCGVPPARALAVEDSSCGILSASQAGLRIISVGPRPLPLADEWHVNLADPSLLTWIATFTVGRQDRSDGPPRARTDQDTTTAPPTQLS
jgi:beta-phosphoglucomutase-like phosphatase (HAD superfamily)